MKTATAYRNNSRPRQVIPYPNAATPREVLHKVLDTVLVAAIGAGMGALLLLLLTLA